LETTYEEEEEEERVKSKIKRVWLLRLEINKETF